jgi:hypothetical protein
MNKVNGQETTVNCFGKDYKVKLILEHYTNQRPAIGVEYWDEELEMTMPFGTLTVNLPGVPLESNQCMIKTYSENDGWAREICDKLGCFDFLRLVSCGYTFANKVQLKEDWTWE